MYIMEGMMNKQNCVTNTSVTCAATPSAALGVHKSSQIISKMKPKIRIIHIFAPEIIKTDVTNFRELVQRLTGKPTDEHRKNNMSCTKKKLPRLLIPGNKNEASRNISTSSFPYHHHHQLIHKPLAKKMGFHYSEFIGERIKGEEEIWRGANSGGGFLGGFAELEGFMEQLNHEFPNTTMPMEISHMDGYGQSQLA